MERNNTDGIRQVQIRMRRELLADLDAECERRCVGRPALIDRAVTEYLANSDWKQVA